MRIIYPFKLTVLPLKVTLFFDKGDTICSVLNCGKMSNNDSRSKEAEMKRILLVEDDVELNNMLATVLGHQFKITQAFSGSEGLLQIGMSEFDLIILDMMLPGKTGEEVLAEIRQDKLTPVIMLTALSDKGVVSRLLLAGANDYLTKPFDIDELSARVTVQLRQQPNQSPRQQEKAWQYKNISLNGENFTIIRGEDQVQLSKKEFDMLKLLIDNPNKIYTKADLYQKIWQEAYYGDENTINVHISNLRKKIQTLDKDTPYIQTVWSLGIKLAD